MYAGIIAVRKPERYVIGQCTLKMGPTRDEIWLAITDVLLIFCTTEVGAGLCLVDRPGNQILMIARPNRGVDVYRAQFIG